MSLFHFGVATEANDYDMKTEDQIWIRNDNGELVLMEEDEDDSDKE